MESYDYHLKAPFCLSINGPSQSGKSSLTLEILKRSMDIITPPIDKVIYCYTEYQPTLFGKMKDAVPNIIFHEGMPQDFGSYGGGQKLMVLDDLMCEASKSNDATNAFTRTSHHQNVSIIFLTQNLFYKNTRTMSLNCKYIIIMKNPRDTTAIQHLGRQMNGGRKNVVMEHAYDDIMKKPYGYLFLDFDQKQNDCLRIRDSIFPENCFIYSNKKVCFQ